MVSSHDSFHHGEVPPLLISQFVVILGGHGIEVYAVGCIGEETGFSPCSIYLIIIQREAFQQPGFLIINKIVEAIDPLNGNIIIQRDSFPENSPL